MGFDVTTNREVFRNMLVVHGMLFQDFMGIEWDLFCGFNGGL